jgi:hypothetical protein
MSRSFVATSPGFRFLYAGGHDAETAAINYATRRNVPVGDWVGVVELVPLIGSSKHVGMGQTQWFVVESREVAIKRYCPDDPEFPGEVYDAEEVDPCPTNA